MSEADAVFLIARNEFSRIFGHPMAMIVVCVLIVMMLVTGIASGSLLIKPLKYAFEYRLSPDEMIYSGIGGVFYNVFLFLTILSLFLGVAALPEERSNGSLRVLMTKPLYKRDIILGKFMGMSTFILMIITLEIAILALIYILMFQGQGFRSIPEIFLRLGFLVFLIFLNSTLMLGLTMFFGTLTKSLFGTLILSVSYLYFEYYLQVPSLISQLQFSPSRLLFSAYAISDINLLNNTFPFSAWFYSALPFIILMVLEVIIIVILDCFMFNVNEDL